MPIADVPITLEVFGSGWVVNVDVTVELPNENPRPAQDGEAEVKFLDIGEIPGIEIFHETPWRITVQGRVPFNVTEFPWIVGYDGIVGANRMQIQARLTAHPEIYIQRDILLGEDSWTWPILGTRMLDVGLNGLPSTATMVALGVSTVAGLSLLYFVGRR